MVSHHVECVRHVFKNAQIRGPKKTANFSREFCANILLRAFARPAYRSLELRRVVISSLPDAVALNLRVETALQLRVQGFFVWRGTARRMLGYNRQQGVPDIGLGDLP